MMKIYRTQDKQLTRVDDMSEGAWICLTSPTDEEVRRVAATLDIEPTDIVAATDPEESARISLEDGYTVIIVDIPVKVDGAGEGIYTTIPLGILLTQELIVTVCSTDTAVIGDFAACRVKEFSTRKKMRFVYQLLYRAATMSAGSMSSVAATRRTSSSVGLVRQIQAPSFISSTRVSCLSCVR